MLEKNQNIFMPYKLQLLIFLFPLYYSFPTLGNLSFTSCGENVDRRGIIMSPGRSGADAILDIILKINHRPLRNNFLLFGENSEEMKAIENPIRVMKDFFNEVSQFIILL